MLVQAFLDAATLSVINITLAQPAETRLNVEMFVKINNAGPIWARLSGFNATLLDPQGRELGWIGYPRLELQGNTQTVQHVESYLSVIDSDAFREEGLKLLAGKSITWGVHGISVVRTFGLPFRVIVRKQLAFEGAQLDNFRATQIRLRSANTPENTYELEADISFSSVSPLELLHFGTLEVELWYNERANDPRRSGYNAVSRSELGGRLCTPAMHAESQCESGSEVSEKVGIAYFYQFTVRRGAVGSPLQPSFKATVRLFNNATSGRLAGRWASQHEQTLISFGPTNKPPYLNRIWQGVVTVEGSPTAMLSGALGTRESFVLGYNVRTGEPCDLYNQGADVCDKGALVMAQNPFGRQWLLREVEYDVYFEEHFEYEAFFRVQPFGQPLDVRAISCAPTNTFARMRSKRGMWSFAPNHRGPQGHGYPGNGSALLAARLADEVIPMPAGAEVGAGTVPFFLTAVPVPGNAERTNRDGKTGPCVLGIATLDPFDCCMTTIFTAAACKMAQRGRSHLNVRAQGRATVDVDGLSMVVYPEVSLPLSYTDDVLNFDVVKGTMLETTGLLTRAGFSCDDIEFRGISEPLWPNNEGDEKPPPSQRPLAPRSPPVPPAMPGDEDLGRQGRTTGVAMPLTLVALVIIVLLSLILVAVVGRLAVLVRRDICGRRMLCEKDRVGRETSRAGGEMPTAASQSSGICASPLQVSYNDDFPPLRPSWS